MDYNRISTQSTKQNTHGTYIMTASFRVLDNHALSYTINHYDTFNVIIYRSPIGNERHDEYFEQFITDLTATLHTFSAVTYIKHIDEVFSNIKGDIILDKSYLREGILIENTLLSYAKEHSLGHTVIESNIVVPIEVVSQKEEYAARTIRPKIHKHLSNYIIPAMEEYPLSSAEKKAIKQLRTFITEKLPYYDLSNHPEYDYTSGLSVYLKYGIISPVRIILILQETNPNHMDDFIEQLVVRRELSYNFVYFNKQYNDFNHITYPWAYQTMEYHQFDEKEYLYTIEDYIQFKTHDSYFNAAMKEMVLLGTMHGYMRMYWCKKIIEWSPSFKKAYEIAIFLNNHYFYDGHTPNGYTGVAWCFGKHDRAWTERNIFGKLRYMNLNGLKRKFDIDEYISKIEALTTSR